MHTILHRLANGGVGSYPPNPEVVAIMMGPGLRWPPERIAWEISKMISPVSVEAANAGRVTYTAALATEWMLALSDGGLTEAQALDLFTRRIQERNGYLENHVIDDSELPPEIRGDRYFRNAVVWDDTSPNKCRCDMPQARGVHMDKIRAVRNAELAAKDITFMRAVEAGDTSAQATIASEKQTLRDIPQTFDLTTVTPEELKAKWPTELPARE
jgi:hypothetical protein